MAKVQLTGGAFQDAEGNLLANGFLLMELSSDSQTDDAQQIGAGVVNRIELDANGDVDETPAQYIWPNDLLTPSDSYYTVRGYKANGQLAYGPQYVQITSPGPFDVGQWVPVAPGTDVPTINILPPIVLPALWWPTLVNSSQKLLGYNFVNSVAFGANGAGCVAKADAAASIATTIRILKNGVQVGTILFAIGSTTGTFTNSAWTAEAGDHMALQVVTGDATLSGISVSMKATRIN